MWHSNQVSVLQASVLRLLFFVPMRDLVEVSWMPLVDEQVHATRSSRSSSLKAK
jgi:hypothetical protein